MSDMMKVNLGGVNLIEASAGTGKTYSLMRLIMRMLVEAKPDPASASWGVPIERMLIVTFTKAATAELADRVRNDISAIIEGIRSLGGRRTPEALQTLDATVRGHIEAWMNIACEGDFLEEVALPKLEAALESLDDAGIHTIHGFCQKMLGENVFASAGSYGMVLDNNQSETLCRTVLDGFLRKTCAKLSESGFGGKQIGDLLAKQESMLALLQEICSAGREIRTVNMYGTKVVKQMVQDHWSALIQTKSDTRKAIDKVAGDGKAFDNMRAIVDPHYDKLPDLSSLTDKEADLVRAIFAEREYRDRITGILVKKAQKIVKSLRADNVEARYPMLDVAVETFEMDVFDEFLRECPEAVRKLKAERGVMGFDDIISGMHDAVAANPDFAEAVRSNYDVVLVDEFQDTDAKQFGIFSKLFVDVPEGASKPYSVFFVGDPKQSIYRFRSADISVYRDAAARSDIAKHTLDTNYRTVLPLVEGLNEYFHLQGVLAKNMDDGAGQTGFFKYEKSEFVSATAGRMPLVEECEDGCRIVPVFELWGNDPEVKGGDPDSSACCDVLRGERKKLDGNGCALVESAAVADDIARLLSGNMRTAGGRKLRPSDIAVLVHKRGRADALRVELARRGIGYSIEGQGSVFNTDEAREILAVLRTIESPDDAKLLTAARCTLLYGDTLSEIRNEDRLVAAKEIQTKIVESFAKYGVWAAFKTLFAELDRRGRGLASRMLSTRGGERIMRNYEHVIELLHRQSFRLKTISGLVGWFEREIKSDKNAGRAGVSDERKLRIESDDDLVRIETVHGSKGLEYPVVYVLRGAAELFDEFDSVSHVRDGGRICVYPGSKNPKDGKTAVEKRHCLEENRELARLAYVALTRASSRLVLPLVFKREVDGLHAVSSGHPSGQKSVYSGLLCGCTKMDGAAPGSEIHKRFADIQTHVANLAGKGRNWEEFVENLRANEPSIRKEDIVADNFIRYRDLTSEPVHEEIRANVSKEADADIAVGVDAVMAASLEVQTPVAAVADWARSSFSSIAKSVTQEGEETFAPAVMDDDEKQVAGDVRLEMAMKKGTQELGIYDLPGGTEFGTAVHGVFELLPLEKVPAMARNKKVEDKRFASELEEKVHALLLDYPSVLGNDEKSHAGVVRVIAEMVRKVVEKEIPGVGRLCQISFEKRRAEFGFVLGVGCSEGRVPLTPALLGKELARLGYDLGEMPSENKLKGYLEGTIDLLMQGVDGKFWVLDWKTNKVRNRPEAIDEKAVDGEMHHHLYRLQYLLYLVALYRMLKKAYGDKAISKFGGAAYVFVRAVACDVPAGIVVDNVRPEVIVRLNDILENGIEPESCDE